jgi:hypothetical protein
MHNIDLSCTGPQYQEMEMAFRADEAAQAGVEEAESYFTRYIDPPQRIGSKEALRAIIDDLGPAVDAYPTWHPLLKGNRNKRLPATTPSRNCGYEGLDHTRFFLHGFITCPYGDGQPVIDSVNQIKRTDDAYITAEILDVPLYAQEATPILVRCHWEHDLEVGGQIPLAIALPLLLEGELPCWRFAEVAETWETMRPYFLGKPHGSRSSLFVSQETGQAIKKVWNALIYTGMFGPIKV